MRRVSEYSSTSSSGNSDDEEGRDAEEQQPWNALGRMQAVRVDGASIGESLKSVMDYEFTINRGQLQRSLTYLGPHHRLRRFVARALNGTNSTAASAARWKAGEPLRVGVVGGSISFGHGASLQGATDWFSLVRNWMRRAFPRAKFEFHNGCVPATPAAFMALCLEHYLDPLVDLVFVEYVLNDGLEDRIVHNRRVRTYERLIRRLLDQPHAPAVVLVQVGVHGMFRSRSAVSDDGVSEWRPFHHTLEDLYGSVSAYYGLSSVSFRNAIYSIGAARDHDFSAYLRDDFIHPNDAGHRVLADSVVYLMQQAAAGLAVWPLDFGDEAAALGRLPEPMYPGNHPALRRVCFQSEDFRSTVITRSSGWEWVNEGTETSPKWGYVSRRMGAVMKVNLDASLAAVDPGATVRIADEAAGGRLRKHTAVLIFAYLKSYEQMGKAQFRCESGCTCKPRYADGTTDLPESTIYFLQLHATPHRNCTVAIINDSDPESENNQKFKVTGVVVNMINEATHELNELDFAEDWPQYGVGGAPMLWKKAPPPAASPAARRAGGRHRLKSRGRLAGMRRGKADA